MREWKEPDLSRAEYVLGRLPVGTPIEAGDFWWYNACDSFMRYDEAPRNRFGFKRKVKKDHAPVYRLCAINMRRDENN